MLTSRSLAITSIVASILVAACADDETTTTGPSNTGGSGATGGAAGGGGQGASDGGSGPTQFMVTIENVSGASELPTPLSPGVWAVHEAAGPFFTAGEVDRAEGLVGIAEDGSPGALASSLDGSTAVVSSGAFDTPEGGAAAGPAFPGDSYSFMVEAMPGEKLNFATMFVQSNDVFISPNGEGIELFDANGAPMAERDVTSEVSFWDVGSEKEEAPGMGPNQAPTQGDPDTGPAESVISRRVDSTRAIPIPSKMMEVAVTETGGTYEITITNTSRAGGAIVSPLSPVFYATHSATWAMFEAGQPASAGLELLAEDGNPATLVADETGADGAGTVGSVTAAGGGPIMPTMSSDVISVTPDAANRFLSLATMLVASNDVFISTPAAGVELLDDADAPRPAADVQADIMRVLQAWDAGTEENQVPGAGANQPPNAGGVDEGGMVALYNDRSNDLQGAELAAFVDVTIILDTGTTFIVNIDNVSNNNPVFGGLITPVAWAVTDGSAGTFTMGMAASAGLEALAEDGSAMGFMTELAALGFVNEAGVEGTAPAGGGSRYIFSVTPTMTHRFFNIHSMVVPSNDTFFALGQNGIELLDAGGVPRSDNDIAADITAALASYDAGTEINQAGAAGPDMAGPQLQAGPDTGAPEGDSTVRALASPVWGYPAPTSVLRVTVAPVE